MPAARSAARRISPRSAARASPGGKRPCEEAAEPGDHRHHVVDFVRDAAGDAGDRLHPLALDHQLGRAPALGHVAHDASDPLGPAVRRPATG